MKRLIATLFVAMLAAHTAVFADESLFRPVSLQDVEEPGSRFYVAGILGASFATLTTDQQVSANDSLFTTGGTLGMAFDLPWRMEVEGRARDPIAGGITVPGGAGSFEATGGWSTMVNLWRDVEVFDDIGIYIGGGIGAGGYRLGYDTSVPGLNTTTAGIGNQTGFAWQAGGGVDVICISACRIAVARLRRRAAQRVARLKALHRKCIIDCEWRLRQIY